MTQISASVRPRILIVDDDQRLRVLLSRYLNEQGFEIREAGDGQEMRKVITREHCDLIVLDLMLPGEDGLTLCTRLKTEGFDIPVLMLTAKGDEVDRIIGLELGADDYLPKPCNPRELVARIKAILRRHRHATPGTPVTSGEIVSFGDCKFDLASRTLTKNDQSVQLTTGEFALLSILVKHAGQPLSRDRLLTIIRGRDSAPFNRSIDVQVSRLRRLIEDDPTRPRYIQTVWGLGYVFVLDDKSA